MFMKSLQHWKWLTEFFFIPFSKVDFKPIKQNEVVCAKLLINACKPKSKHLNEIDVGLKYKI
jgi:hypothetical protein